MSSASSTPRLWLQPLRLLGSLWCCKFHRMRCATGALAPIALATLALARSGAVPMVVHLDHATDTSLVDEAIELGFGSVMFDASTMPYVENVAATAAVVQRCLIMGWTSRLSLARSVVRTVCTVRVPEPSLRRRGLRRGDGRRCASSRRRDVARHDRTACRARSRADQRASGYRAGAWCCTAPWASQTRSWSERSTLA